jgi:hypothetical protein
MRSHVYYYTYLPPPAVEATARFDGGPSEWLPPPAEPTDLGWLVDLRADGVLPAQLAVQRAEVLVGRPQRPGEAVLRTLSWHARNADRLFPVLGGALELLRLPAGGCQLRLTATYRPPLSVVGGAADKLLGHRVAEACVRDFVLRVADRLRPATLQACI